MDCYRCNGEAAAAAAGRRHTVAVPRQKHKALIRNSYMPGKMSRQSAADAAPASPMSDSGSALSESGDDGTVAHAAAKHWRRFTKWVESTTFHGFDQIVLSNSWLARIFWSLTMVIVFIVVFIQLKKLILYFINNPTLTSIQLVYPEDGMGLPLLTLCTLTKLNMSTVEERYPRVNQTLTEFATSSFLSAYSTALMDPEYFHRKGHDLDELEATLFDALSDAGTNFSGFIEDTAMQCKGQFLACWFENGHMFDCCKRNEFVNMNRFLSHSGSCFAFAATESQKQMLPGPVGGFGFVYWYPNEHLLETAYNGYDEHAVHLYMSPTDALLEKNPIALPVGYHTHISLSATKTIRMKYDELGRSTCETPELKYFANYTFPACQVECLIDAMIDRCNCTGLSSYGRIPRDRVCTPAQALKCYKTQAKVFTKLLVKCRKEKCIEACEYWSYQASLTVGKVFNPKLKDKMLEYWRLPEGNPDLSLIIGDVYFEEIQYTEVTQMPALTIEAFISSIGGAMGLWTGASIITWIHLLYFCCNYMCFGKSPLKAAHAVTNTIKRRQHSERSAGSRSRRMADMQGGDKRCDAGDTQRCGGGGGEHTSQLQPSDTDAMVMHNCHTSDAERRSARSIVL